MERLYVFLIRNDVWIYILCGLGLTWYMAELWRARRILRGAMFGLEKERGRQMQQTALTFIVFFAAVIGLVTYVNSQVAPTLPQELLKPPTPTPNVFATPLSSPTSIGGEATATFAVAPTVTLRSPDESSEPPAGLGTIPAEPEETPAETATATLPAQAGGCNPGVEITAPPNGITATGIVTFFGTATSTNFAALDLEVYGPETDGGWLSLLGQPATSPVLDGILGRADFTNWAPGDYLVRLRLLDDQGGTASQCIIQISVTTSSS